MAAYNINAMGEEIEIVRAVCNLMLSAFRYKPLILGLYWLFCSILLSCILALFPHQI